MFDKRVYRGVTVNALVVPTNAPQQPKTIMKPVLPMTKVFHHIDEIFRKQGKCKNPRPS